MDRELSLGRRGPSQTDGAHRRILARSWALAIGAHLAVLLLVVVISQQRQPIRVGVDSPRAGIDAFVLPGAPPAAAPAPRPVPRPREVVRSSQPAADVPQDAAESGADSTEGTTGQSPDGGTGGGPVRLSQGNIQLLKRVVPEYPPVMRSAGVSGLVILDAIIQRDGTIGDITVLQSSSPVFERAAIAAVKQWQYSPIPYEGVLTVTLTFRLE